MNCLMLVGKVKDAEVKTAKGSGKSFLVFTLLVKKPEWDNSEGLEEIPITAFGKTAEKNEDLHANEVVEVRGRVGSDKKDGKSGGHFINIKVFADDISRWPKSGTASTGGSQPQGSGAGSPNGSGSGTGTNPKPPADKKPPVGEQW